MNNTPEAQMGSRAFATRLGYKARILKWPLSTRRGYTPCHLARERGKDFRSALTSLIRASRIFLSFFLF